MGFIRGKRGGKDEILRHSIPQNDTNYLFVEGAFRGADHEHGNARPMQDFIRNAAESETAQARPAVSGHSD